MKTSTPTGSPLRRRISSFQNFIEEDNENDLEAEKQKRRLEAINKSSEVRRKSAVAPLLAGLDASQLAQHCQDCIKLSTENKINSKNAFSFLLIDFMAAMAKKSDSEINKNFQVASCTLDASVKIYGYRVDAIHTDAVKIAGGFRSKELDLGSGPEDQDKGSGGEDQAELKQKKRKKKKRKMTIVNPETLNAKAESDLALASVPQQNFLVRHGDGNDLLMKIPILNDEGLVLVDSELPCWPYTENMQPALKVNSKESCDVDELLGLLKTVEVPTNVPLCSAYRKFDFFKEDIEDASEDEFQVSQSSNRFEFDLNGSIQNVDMSDADLDNVIPEIPNQRARLEVPVGGYDSGEDIAVPMRAANIPSKRIVIADMKRRISVHPLEYSLFDDKIFKSWAGPKYWKIRPSYSKHLGENKENEDASKQVAFKRTRKGRVKEVLGLFEVNGDVLAHHLAIVEKSTLCRQTMLNWNSRNTTMPKDCKYGSKKLFTLYHLPYITVEPKLTTEDDELEESEANEVADNVEELDYCSSLIMQDKDYSNVSAPEEGKEAEDMNESRMEVETWGADNMVAVPNKVEKIALSTFKRKRHVDIKQLKKSIWNILLDDDTSGKLRVMENAKMSRPNSFSRIVQGCISKMVANGTALSAPLIFNALLHLTNEKSLVLTQDNHVDFQIFQ